MPVRHRTIATRCAPPFAMNVAIAKLPLLLVQAFE
jgi:hypothetical protein